LKIIPVLLIIILGCGPVIRENEIDMNWTEFDLDLPEGITVYEGYNKDIPLRAWVGKIDLNNELISVKILSSTDTDRKETPLQFLQNTGARLIINGGYFRKEINPSQHVGLLKTKGTLEEPASPSVYRDNLKYYINRGAFGINNDGNVDIGWCTTNNDSIFEWKRPLMNRPGFPAEPYNMNKNKLWNVRDAVHAGPVIIFNNEIYVTDEEEVFFNTPISGVQPRSAIGYTDNQELILMVVDGRQQFSRGVYLEELALLMNQFNCVEALNLDGGGSSAMVADSRLLNRPSGTTYQREIMSAIGIFYE